MKKIKLILFVVALATLNFSCLVDDSTGDDLLESFSNSPYIVGFDKKLDAVSYFEDEGVVSRDFTIELKGGQESIPADQDITINYEIDPSSTAVEGVEFDFTDNSGSVVIPAGGLFTFFTLDINTGSFDANVSTKLNLKLTTTGSNGSVVSANDSLLQITFVGCVSDASDYNYNVVVTREDTGTVLNLGTEVLYFEGINNFRTFSSATLDGPGNGAPVDQSGIDFSVLCGEINIPSQGLFQGLFAGNEVVGTEVTTIDEDGNFELKYSANYGGTTGVVNFTGVYTRQ